MERLRDGLRRTVDIGIKPVVTGLRAHGFDTSWSCEGHLDDGPAAPYVTFTARLVEQGMWPAALLPSYRNWLRYGLGRALTGFYEEHEPKEGMRLEVSLRARHVLSLRIDAVGRLEERPLDERKMSLEASQREMNSFAGFLKRRFLEGEPVFALDPTEEVKTVDAWMT